MEIGAICNLGVPEAQVMPAANEGSISGLFGMSMQTAMENVQLANVQKDLGKGKDLEGMALIAQLLTAALSGGNGTVISQDVEQMVTQLMEQTDLSLDQLLSGDSLEKVAQDVLSLLQQSGEGATGQDDSLFQTIMGALKEISDYAEGAKTLEMQTDQSAASKVAGEMRVLGMKEKQDGMIPQEDIRIQTGHHEAAAVLESQNTPKEADQGQTFTGTARQDGGKSDSLENLVLPKSNGTFTVKMKTEENAGSAFVSTNPASSPVVFHEAAVEKPLQAANLSRTILDQIETAIGQNTNQLYIRLKPDTLGGIAMRLIMSEEGLVARIVTNNTQTQAALNQQISGLESALKEQGIQVANIEISYNAMTDDTRRQSSAFSQESGGGRQNHQGVEQADWDDQEEMTAIYDAMMAPMQDVDGSTVYRA